MPKTPSQPRVVHIYALIDPRTDAIRYVGKTHDRLSNRLSGHCKDTRHQTYKTHWVASLKRLDLRPLIVSLEMIEDSDDSQWQEAERFWIAYLRFLGCRLTNLDAGGRGGTSRSPETIRKLSVSHMGQRKGIPRSAEVRAKISRTQKGIPRPVTLEHREKLIQSLVIARTSDQAREKHKEGLKKRVYTAQHRQRLGKAISKASDRRRWKKRFERAGVTGMETVSELLNSPKFLMELVFLK